MSNKTEGTMGTQETKTGLTEIVFVLDRSGSMGGLESDTIGGYNAMLAKQKQQEGDAVLSTVLFDGEVEVLHDRVPLREVEMLTDEDYYVRGTTALLDAVGGAIHHIRKIHKAAPREAVPAKTLFIITTDGYENASQRYSYRKVRKMVERQKQKHGWEFLFLGANIDAVEVAGRFGVAANRAARYECDGAGTRLNFEAMSSVISCARSAPMGAKCLSDVMDEADFLAPIREDYKRRGRS